MYYNIPINQPMWPLENNTYEKLLEIERKIDTLTKKIENLEQSLNNNYNNSYNINKDSGIYMI